MQMLCMVMNFRESENLTLNDEIILIPCDFNNFRSIGHN